MNEKVLCIFDKSKMWQHNPLHFFFKKIKSQDKLKKYLFVPIVNHSHLVTLLMNGRKEQKTILLSTYIDLEGKRGTCIIDVE